MSRDYWKQWVLVLCLLLVLPGCRNQPAEETPAPPPGETVGVPVATAIISVTPQNPTAGAQVIVTGAGLPANATVGLALGQIGGGQLEIGNRQTDATGNLNTQFGIPADAPAGQQLEVLVTLPDGQVLRSPPMTVQGGQVAPTATATQAVQPPAPTATTAGTPNLFTQTNIYLIRTDDGGPVGCGDTAVPVQINIEPTVAPLTAALNAMLAIPEQIHQPSGLYNALYQSNLVVQGVNISNGRATIALTGEFVIGGVCDGPRVQAQLQQTALQFSTVNSVVITINGVLLENVLSGAGRG